MRLKTTKIKPLFFLAFFGPIVYSTSGIYDTAGNCKFDFLLCSYTSEIGSVKLNLIKTKLPFKV